jgi:hypothetical protein
MIKIILESMKSILNPTSGKGKMEEKKILRLTETVKSAG